MKKLFRRIALVIALLAAIPLGEACAAAVSRSFPGGVDGVGLTLSCEPGPIAADYVAETASGVPLTDLYATERDAGKGLVRLMSEGGRGAKQYLVPRRLILAIVKMKYDRNAVDRVDLVFTSSHLALVQTTATNAGVFTASDVYELPYGRNGGVDRRPLKANRRLLHLLDLGLASYHPSKAKCDVMSSGAPSPGKK